MKQLQQAMSLAINIEELGQLFRMYFLKEGIRNFAFTYYNEHTKSKNPLIYDWGTPSLKRWHQYYLEQGYSDVDRTLESLEKSLIPVFWDVHEQLKQAKNRREKRIREESIAFGIDKGLCIPLHGPGGDFVVLVLHQFVGEHGLANWEERQYAWLSATHIYLHYLRLHLLPENTQRITLTKREQICLNLTAEGMRTDWIASHLNITQRTVHFHLQNANKKLGAKNKYLAVIAWKSEIGLVNG